MQIDNVDNRIVHYEVCRVIFAVSIWQFIGQLLSEVLTSEIGNASHACQRLSIRALHDWSVLYCLGKVCVNVLL